MGLTILEHLTLFWWHLIDIRAVQEYEYWIAAGMQAKYAFEKTLQTIKNR